MKPQSLYGMNNGELSTVSEVFAHACGEDIARWQPSDVARAAEWMTYVEKVAEDPTQEKDVEQALTQSGLLVGSIPVSLPTLQRVRSVETSCILGNTHTSPAVFVATIAHELKTDREEHLVQAICQTIRANHVLTAFRSAQGATTLFGNDDPNIGNVDFISWSAPQCVGTNCRRELQRILVSHVRLASACEGGGRAAVWRHLDAISHRPKGVSIIAAALQAGPGELRGEALDDVLLRWLLQPPRRPVVLPQILPATAAILADGYFPFFTVYATFLFESLAASDCDVATCTSNNVLARVKLLHTQSTQTRMALQSLIARHEREQHAGQPCAVCALSCGGEPQVIEP